MKKPLLYPKLAWQGIRKNAETYLPYLLMGILMVGVSYIMNYLTRPALMGALSMGGTTLMVLQMGKIVISVFSVIFLYYCNSFLIRRRMKEFGLYNILGMGKGNRPRDAVGNAADGATGIRWRFAAGAEPLPAGRNGAD